MVISPYRLSYDKLIELTRESRSRDYKRKGWVELYSTRTRNEEEYNQIMHFFQMTISSEANGYKHSKCGDIMIILTEYDEHGCECAYIRAKNMSGRPIDTIDSAFMYTELTGVPVFLETMRNDILGKDLRVDGYVNKGVRDAESLRDIYKQRCGLDAPNITYVNIPLVNDMVADVCCETGLAIVSRYRQTSYTDHDGERYRKNDMAFSTYDLLVRHRGHQKYCSSCGKYFIDNEIEVFDDIIYPRGCRDCLSRSIYNSTIYISDRRLPLATRSVIPATNHVKKIQYMVRGNVITTNLNMAGRLGDSDARLVAPTKTSGCEPIACDGFDDIMRIDVVTRSTRRNRKREGRIMIYVCGPRMICLLYIKSGDGFTLCGRIRQRAMGKIISNAMIDKKDMLIVNVLFASYDMATYMLRYPVSMRVSISDNYEAMNKIKKMYATSLLKGSRINY